MTELAGIFSELGLSQYLQNFLEQGFDTWHTILDIKESDFDALGVKLGHRRKLQRKIANSRGLSPDRALESPRHTPNDDRSSEERKAGSVRVDVKESGGATQGAKRKYRRHPKPDENAPERPPSAYVIFSNKMREELKGMNLSFTEIAKLVGENWQNLSPNEKEPYEQQAFTAKEKYNNELAEYKKTDHYKNYQQYLADFKARQSNQQTEASKRPKLEAKQSNGSNETASNGSQNGMDTPNHQHVESSSIHSHWPNADSSSSSPQPSTMAKLSVGVGAPRRPGSPSTTSPTVLPGYRESIFGGGHQSLPWRDGRNEGSQNLQQYPQLANAGDRRPSQPGLSVADSPIMTGSAQHAHRTGQSHVPPSLTRESTNRSSSSSVSTTSAFLTPRTPLEPSLERGMPLPSLYSQKSVGNYENQLPPLRPPSMSPQTAMLSSQQSPNGIHPIMDFPPTIAPIRGYNSTAPQYNTQVDLRQREYAHSNTADENLDPVSALIRAGEIVNRTSQDRTGT